MSPPLSDQLPIPGLDVQLTIVRLGDEQLRALMRPMYPRLTDSELENMLGYWKRRVDDVQYVAGRQELDADLPLTMTMPGNVRLVLERRSGAYYARAVTPYLVAGVMM